MSKRHRLFVLLAGICWLTPSALLAQEPRSEKRELVRELFVPFEDLDVLLGHDAQRVFMTRQEYEQLKRAAVTSPEAELPLQVAALSANYKATLSDGRAIVDGILTMEVLQKGLQALPLQFAGVGIRAAQLDGEPAKLASDEQGRTLLLVEGVGTHEVTLQMVMPVATDAAQQTLNFQLPQAATGTLELLVPGNVEVKSGAAIVHREVDAANNTTTLHALLTRDPISIVMSLNNRKLREQTTIMARGVLISELTAAYERLHATMSLNVIGGATDEFRFSLGDDLEVNSVATELLNRWEINSDSGSKELIVRLRTPTTERVVITMRLDRMQTELADWRQPDFAPVDVAGYTAVIGIVSEDRLQVANLEAEALLPIDSQVLTSAIPPSLLAAEPGAPRVQATAAFYAPSAEYVLTAQLSLPQPALVVSANTLVSLSDEGLEAAGGFSLVPENEKLFYFDFQVPQDWNVTWIRLGDETELKFERHEQSSPARYRVQLPGGVPPGTQQAVLFEARYAPPAWIDDWDAQTIELPSFPVLGTRVQEGAIGLQTQDELVATPGTTQNLIVLNENEKAKYRLGGISTAFAYRYNTPSWQATIDIARTQPRQIARVFSFFQVQLEAIEVHQELVFFVERARARQLSFSLPESTPSEISIRALGNVGIKETSSTVTDGRRVWVVDLAERHAGSVRLAVDFTQPLAEGESTGVALPVARAEGVEYQSGAMSIEGHPELDTRLTQNPREVDIGELAEADYQVGTRLLGVFGYVGNEDQALVDITRRPVHGLPTTIVERAEFVSLVSTIGRCTTAARFRLRTKATYLELRLPDESSLWSVLLDGTPALPQREADRVLVALPAGTGHAIRDLQIVYESPTQSVGLRGELEVQAPELFERATRDEQGQAVPVADRKWQFILPDGYAWVTSDGGLTTANRPSSRVQHLFNTLWNLGGGQKYVAVQMAREAARSSVASPEESLRRMRPESLQSQMPASGFVDDLASESRLDYMDVAGDMQDLFSAEATPQAPPASLDFALQAEPNTAPTAEPQRDLSGAEISGPEVGAADKDAAQASALQVTGGQRLWALEGVRSLPIPLAKQISGQQVHLQSLGTQPQVRLTLVNTRRTDWLALVFGFVVFLLGLTRSTWPSRLTYMFLILLLVALAPLVSGWITELAAAQSCGVAALLILMTYYLLQTSLRGFSASVCSRWYGHAAGTQTVSTAVTKAILLAILVVGGGSDLRAQEDAAQAAVVAGANAQMVTSPDQLRRLLRALDDGGTVSIPDDAVVIPYEPTAEFGVAAAEKLLVPYKTYEKLWNLAHPDQRLQAVEPPADFAWAGAEYTAQLDGSASLVMEGRLLLEQFVDRELAIGMPLAGCVLESATLNGRPAKLQLVAPQPSNNAPNGPFSDVQAHVQQQAFAVPQAAVGPGVAPSMLMLYTSGAGTKELRIKVRWQLETSGGWRLVDGQIPSAPACSLRITATRGNTEIRFGGLTDRASYTTTRENESVETALEASGRLALRWRDKISEAVIDQGLTVQSSGVFDVQEDGLRLAWHAELEFRRGRRNAFTFHLPLDYLVEKVVGNNIRGWTTERMENVQRLDVELLKAAVERESLVIILSKQSTIQTAATDGDAAGVVVPEISVPDAMLQQGHFTVRRSALLDLRASEPQGLSRIDVPDESGWLSEHEQTGPLPLKTYQAYQFSQPSFRLELQAATAPQRTTAQTQSLLKISQMDTKLETRLLIDASDRPIYSLHVLLPQQLTLDAPLLSGQFQWSIRDAGELGQAGQRLLEIYMADGRQGEFSIILQGKLDSGDADASAPIPLPNLEVLGAERQIGAIVVQADPAYDIRPENLVGCEVALLQTVSSWLSNSQTRLARTVIQSAQPRFSGQLAITPRTPSVSSVTVSNIKVTDRAIEETIYIEADIASAGIKEFAFVLPAGLATARIQAPLLRQTILTPLNTQPDAPVRVLLQLQDAIMGQFAVIIEHDRLLSPGVQVVPLPIVETGETSLRLITLENASRDELATDQVVSIEQLDQAQLQQQRRLRSLGGVASQVYRVREDQAALAPPLLTFSTTSRAIVETSGARIGLAQALLVVDDLGAYRGTQEYRVENRTEPFLEIVLPPESRLWTVQVAGEPVKPSAVPGAGQNVRVPLIKTAEGDLDYAVVLKYGGSLPRPGRFGKTAFPLIKTVNINVELSQVRLRLPESLNWYGFDGTLGRVQSEGELQAGWLSFRTRQLAELGEMLSSSGTMYSKMRAQNNLKQLEATIEQQNRNFTDSNGPIASIQLQREQVANTSALSLALQQVTEFESSNAVSEVVTSNRFRLNDLYETQTNGRSFNVVDELGSNFHVVDDRELAGAPTPSAATQANQAKGQFFDNSWFFRNQLGQVPSDSEVSRIMPSDAEENERQLARQQGDKPLEAPELQQKQLGDDLYRHDASLAKQKSETLGDYRQQAEKYNSRLQQQNAAGLADEMLGRKGMMRSGRADSAAPAAGNSSGGYGGYGGEGFDAAMEGARGGGYGGGYGGGGMYGGGMGGGGREGVAGGEGVDPFGVGGAMFGAPNRASGSRRLAETDIPALAFQVPQSESDFQGGTNLNYQLAAPAGPATAREAYMASLDVELPLRGTEYFFTTPGGDVQLAAQSVSVDFISRMTSIAVILGLAVVAIACYRLGKSLSRTASGRHLLSFVAAMLGLISIVTGTLPIFGLLLLLIAVAVLLARPSGSEVAPSTIVARNAQ